MLWVGSEAHDVYLGTRAVAVCKGPSTTFFNQVVDYDAALMALGSWLREAPARCRLRIWLSGGLCRPFIVPPVPGVRSELEWRRMASALTLQHTGLTGACQVWVDAAKDSAPRVAAAVQQSRLAQLLALVNDLGRGPSTLQSIRPWWGDVLRAALLRDPNRRAVAAQDCDSLTVLVGEAGDEAAFVVATTLTPVIDRETADSALARWLLSANVSAGQEVLGRLQWQDRHHANKSKKSDVALSPLVDWSR